MKVSVYFNLHKKCWSVRHRGRVISHADRVEILDPRFRVSRAGRERVLREKKKNVHAFVVGELVSFGAPTGDVSGREVTYNPYRFETFVYKQEETPVFDGTRAVLENKRVFVS